MKIFECVVDDGETVFNKTIAAKSKKELKETYGDVKFKVIADATTEYFSSDSVDFLRGVLVRGGFGDGETSLICALLKEHIDKVGTRF